MVGKPALWMTLSTLTSCGLALSSSAQEELNTKIRVSMSKNRKERKGKNQNGFRIKSRCRWKRNKKI